MLSYLRLSAFTLFVGLALYPIAAAVPIDALAQVQVQETTLVARQSGAPQWASRASATIFPGVNTNTAGGSCTSNFIFYRGSDVFIGHAAHCSSTGEASQTNGCSAGASRPEGTPVNITGASRPGTLAYNSWVRMSASGEKDANACNFNDFALVKIDPIDVPRVNPTIPTFGGPSGIRAASATLRNNENIYSYGSSVLRQGLTFLSPKYGLNIATQNGGWDHNTYTFTPGIPGDSGSGFVDGQGRAYGVLSTLQFAPRPFSNGVANLPLALQYLNRFDDFQGLTLATGTAPFRVALPGLSGFGNLFGGGAKAASQRSATLKDLK